MKEVANGFQCEKCRTIYSTKEKAEICEFKSTKEPLFKIGDIFIDDSYDVETEIKVCEIYIQGHDVSYRMEWQSPDGNGEWEELYTLYESDLVNNYRKDLKGGLQKMDCYYCGEKFENEEEVIYYDGRFYCKECIEKPEIKGGE